MSKKTDLPTLFLIDGNSFMHRAANTMPAFNNKAGHPTGAMTGFLNMMVSVINDHNPDKCIVTFDHKGKTFRHDIFPEYKGTRPPSDPDLAKQFGPIKEIVKAWGYPVVSIEGVEADDTMSTLADMGVAQGYLVYLVTSDKDMCQKVSEKVLLLDTKNTDKKGKALDVDGVYEKLGVYPVQVIDLLAIMGDKSDNVPGAEGVGQVTASKWLNKYDSLDGILANIDELKGAYAEKFKAQIDNVLLSKKLVTIDSNVNIGMELNEIKGERNEDKLYALTQEFEMKKFQLAADIKNTNAETLDIKVIDLDESESNISFESLMNDVQEGLFIEIAETKKDKMLFFSSQSMDENVVYKVNLTKEIALKIMSMPLLMGNDTKNTLKLLSMASEQLIEPTRKVMDTRVYNYNLNGGSKTKAAINVINQISANIEISELRVTNKLDTDKPKWDKLKFEELLIIKAQEVLIARKTLSSDEHNSLLESYRPLSMDYELLPVLARMEQDGVLVDKQKLEELNIVLSDQLNDMSKEIFEIAGEEFNIASVAQVKRILFDVMEIPSKKKSTAESEMNKLAVEHRIVKLILDWRSLSKKISTYVVGIINRLDSNNRVHCEFNQTVAATGRLSARDPNLQSIPVASEDGRKIRSAFIASNGKRILALDYSQIEMRILAHVCEQPELIDAFLNDVDVHAATASDIFNVNIEDVTYEQRRAAKAINFSLIYGKGSKALAQDLDIEVKEAKQYIADYFEKYSLVKPSMEDILDFARANLFVRTLFGRKVLTRDINAKNPMVRPHAENAAKNAPYQGTAADIIKEAMIATAKYISENNLHDDVSMLIQVHDELVFEISEDRVDEMAKIIAEIMENVIDLKVPLVVDHNVANNWSDAH